MVLKNTEGWWNKLVADDIDGDGDMDIIAGNLGENYKFQQAKEKPFEVYAKDFDNNGTNDIFLAKHIGDITGADTGPGMYFTTMPYDCTEISFFSFIC